MYVISLRQTGEGGGTRVTKTTRITLVNDRKKRMVANRKSVSMFAFFGEEFFHLQTIVFKYLLWKMTRIFNSSFERVAALD